MPYISSRFSELNNNLVCCYWNWKTYFSQNNLSENSTEFNFISFLTMLSLPYSFKTTDSYLNAKEINFFKGIQMRIYFISISAN